MIVLRAKSLRASPLNKTVGLINYTNLMFFAARKNYLNSMTKISLSNT